MTLPQLQGTLSHTCSESTPQIHSQLRLESGQTFQKPQTLVNSSQTSESKFPYNSQAVSVTGIGSSLGAGLSVKVNTNTTSSEAVGTLAINLVEKELELNMNDLETSEDEDLSAGPSGGCTGEA